MKIKVVSYYVDGGSEKHLQLSKVTEQINRKYCELHGYDIQFVYMTKQEYFDFYKEDEKQVTYLDYKIPFISEQLNKQDCDYLVFLDADAPISKPQIKIEDLVDDTHQFFLCRGNEKVIQINCLINIANKINQIFQREHSEHYLTKNYYDQTIMKDYDMFGDFEWLSWSYLLFNEGFMIIKNTPTMREFWDRAYKYEMDFFIHMDRTIVSHGGQDGRVIKFMLLQKKYNPLYTFMPQFAMGGVANSFETRYDVEKHFVLHNYGQALTDEQKIEWAQSLKNNKWWKEYYK